MPGRTGLSIGGGVYGVKLKTGLVAIGTLPKHGVRSWLLKRCSGATKDFFGCGGEPLMSGQATLMLRLRSELSLPGEQNGEAIEFLNIPCLNNV